MAGDSFQEVTYTNWFQRIWQSIGGAILGIILFLVSFVVLFWNEGRAVDTARSLDEAGRTVVTVPADKVDPANDGKLVHVTGKAATDETLTDERFGVAANAIRLVRHVEMYQWKQETKEETKNRVGGGQEKITTYSYIKVWSDKPIDSGGFKEAAGHVNPGALPAESKSFQAKLVKLGAFELTEGLIAQMQKTEPLPVAADSFAKWPSEEDAKRWKITEGMFYRGDDSTNPQVGDVRVTFAVVKPAEVSVMAAQSGKTFQPFQPKSASRTINLLHMGTRSAQEMIQAEQEANTTLTWILRLVGFVLMGVGIFLVLNPLQTFSSVIPFLGGLVGFVLAAFSCVVAGVLSLVTIAVAWIFYRPILGISLLAVAAVGVVGLVILLRRRRATVKPG